MGFGIGQDDGGFVVYMRVDVGLDLLSNGGDGERALANEFTAGRKTAN